MVGAFWTEQQGGLRLAAATRFLTTGTTPPLAPVRVSLPCRRSPPVVGIAFSTGRIVCYETRVDLLLRTIGPFWLGPGGERGSIMTDENDPGAPDIPPALTPIQQRRLEAAANIVLTPPEDITYQHTVLCQTALPYRDPGDAVREWERGQGTVSLRVEAGAAHDPHTQRYVKLGLPYGSRPRMILAHLNREALLQGSPCVEVESSLTAFVRRIQSGRPPRGAQINRFKDQLARLSAATIRLAVDLSATRALQVNTQIISAFELWSRTSDGHRVLWPSEVRLSLDYFDSLSRHAVPLDERAIAALANSALALDVYSWLAQRLHRIPKDSPQRVTWPALHGQFGHGYHHIRQFRAAFLKVLALVHTQYRAAKVAADETGLELRHSPPPVTPRLVSVHKLLG